MQQQGAIVYALMRLASAVPTLLLVIVLAFLMMRAAPGGPFDDQRALPAETAANIERAYDLDAPLHRQLLTYIGGVVRGDLGPSYRVAVVGLDLKALGLQVVEVLDLPAREHHLARRVHARAHRGDRAGLGRGLGGVGPVRRARPRGVDADQRFLRNPSTRVCAFR